MVSLWLLNLNLKGVWVSPMYLLLLHLLQKIKYDVRAVTGEVGGLDFDVCMRSCKGAVWYYMLTY